MSVSDAAQPVTGDQVRCLVLSFGADLVGFAPTAQLEEALPRGRRPSDLMDGAATLIVVAKRVLHGIVWSRHLPNKQLAGGRNLRALDRMTTELAYRCESWGHAALPVASAAFDFAHRHPEDVTPAGQGSLPLRTAAVEAGLGTWGLNDMVLTREYGPRVFFGGVLTTLELAPDRSIEGELCPGLEACGRCAAVCPSDAIPRRAPVDAPVAEVRSLDCTACARSCQPYGYQVALDYLEHVLESGDAHERFQRVYRRMTGEIWLEMTMMKEAAITGCSDCTQVCPVGDDFDVVRRSPHRRVDLPDEIPRRTVDGQVEVEHMGPKIRRRITWQSQQQTTN
jgi:epoxyqueuosine reductase QueG